MKKLLLMIVVFTVSIYSHDNVPDKIFVDTDMGLDDISSVILLSKLQNVQVRAFITSDGVQSPTVGAQRLKRIFKMTDSKHNVFIGRDLDKKEVPKSRKFLNTLDWEELPEIPVNYKYLKGVIDIINNTKDKFSYVCLGPATNLAILLDEIPEMKDRLNAVYFSGNIPETGDDDLWNYERDPESMDKVLQTGVPVYIFGLKDEQLPVFSQQSWNKIPNQKNIHSKALKTIYQKREVLTHLFVKNNILNLYDDAIPVYFAEPAVGEFELKEDNIYVIKSWNRDFAQETFFKKLSEPYEPGLFPRETVLLREYPESPQSFRPDVRPYVTKIIETHGQEEWKASIIANEMHRHLGTYSIIGVKMGIRAREILNAKPDDVRVKSLVGFEPPMSCMNDGIQIATGATLGRGTIEVTQAGEPKAEFYTNMHKVTLTLKKEIHKQIQDQIAKAAEEHGMGTYAYFKAIREISLKNWLELDRKQIFEEEKLQVEIPKN